MIYRVKNCIMYDGSRNGLLFSVENGVSRVMRDLPNGADVREIDANGALLFPAFTDIGAKCYDKCRESSESVETASAAASVGGYRRIVTLGGSCFGDGRVITANNVKDGAESQVACDGVFVSIGRKPTTHLFEGVITLDGGGYIAAGEDTKTNIEGVFAAGDVRTKLLRQVVTATADGAVAAYMAEAYLNS